MVSINSMEQYMTSLNVSPYSKWTKLHNFSSYFKGFEGTYTKTLVTRKLVWPSNWFSFIYCGCAGHQEKNQAQNAEMHSMVMSRYVRHYISLHARPMRIKSHLPARVVMSSRVGMYQGQWPRSWRHACIRKERCRLTERNRDAWKPQAYEYLCIACCFPYPDPMQMWIPVGSGV